MVTFYLYTLLVCKLTLYFIKFIVLEENKCYIVFYYTPINYSLKHLHNRLNSLYFHENNL